MAGEERETEAEALVERPAAAPDVAPESAPDLGLSPLQSSVIGLSRGLGNAAVARALTDGESPARVRAMAALARSKRAAAAPTVAPRPPQAEDDGLGSAFGTALARRAAGREGETPSEPSPRPAGAALARSALARDETTVDASAAQTAADAAYEALDGIDDVDALLAALAGKGPDERWAIRMAFQEAQGYSLGWYLTDQLSGDDLVKAAGLLESSNVFEDHVALGLALIPSGTRESEVFRILEGTPFEARATLAGRYNAAFGSGASTGPLGKGSLAVDLADDLDEEDAYRATTLLTRDLTPGDRLYLASVAIAGTREDDCVSIVQEAWKRGPAGVAQLETEWAATPAATGLRAAMKDELGGEALGLVNAVLDAYDAVSAGGGAASGAPDPATRDLVEGAQFDAAYSTYGAAAEGLGTNETQAGEAVETMRRLIEDRTARARAAGVAEGADPLLSTWQERLSGLDLEDELGGVELQRVEFQRSAALEPADELYLAMRDGDEAAAVDIVTKAWAAGKVDGLEEACSTERTIGDQVRPAFNINFAVGMRGINAMRLWTLANHDYTQIERGARRLAAELDEGSSEAELGGALAFLNLASPELRNAVVERFAAMRELPGDGSAGARFAAYVKQRYGETPLVVDARDLVDPVSAIEDPRARIKALLERGRDRYELSEPGLFFSLPVATVLPGAPTSATIGDLVREYDRASGNDVFAVSKESLDRLEWIVEHATDEEIASLAGERGIKVDDEAQEKLATGEYGRLKERLSEVDALVRTVTEAIATAVELAVSAAITAATGGAAAGLFAAAMASAIAGMLVREAALGDRYELASKENAEKLVTAALGAALGAFGGSLLEGAGAIEKLQAMGRLGAFAADAAQEAFTQVGNALGAGMFADRLPHAEDVALNALSMLVAVGAAGTGGSIRFGLEDTTPLAEQLRTRFIANLTANLMNGSAELGSELAKSGTGNLTGVDILGLAGRKGLMATASAVTATLGETGAAQKRAADAEAERQAERDAERPPEGEPTPEPPDNAGEAVETEPEPEHPAGHEPDADDLAGIDGGPVQSHPHGDASYPDGLVHYGLSAQEAHDSYEASITGQPADEVGMWRNLDTGEHVVVQGNNAFVSGDFRADPTFAEGRWVAVKHFHPSGEYHARFPSLQDFRYLAAQALRNRAEGETEIPYTMSSIDYLDAQGKRQTTEFGYDGAGKWFVRYVDYDGQRVSQPFANAPHGPDSEYVRYLYDRGIPIVDATSAPEGDLATLGADRWAGVGGRVKDDGVVRALKDTDATPETVTRLLDLKQDGPQIGMWALDHGETGLRVIAALVDGGVSGSSAEKAVLAAKGVPVPADVGLPGTLLDLVVPLVESGKLRNANSLRAFLTTARGELLTDRAGRAQELAFALEMVMAGHEVQLGGGADVVVRHKGGGGEAVQHKNLTTPDERNVAEDLQYAIRQLSGEKKEYPPGYEPGAAATDPKFKRVVDLRVREPATPPATLPTEVTPYRLNTATREELLAWVIATTVGYDAVDEIRITNSLGTFTFDRAEFKP